LFCGGNLVFQDLIGYYILTAGMMLVFVKYVLSILVNFSHNNIKT